MSETVFENAFERGIERFANMLFDNRGGVNAFEACLRELPEGYMQLQDLAERAMRACNWFARHAPCRYQPLPLVYYDEIKNILRSDDFHRHLVVYYRYSLRQQGFDYVKHPGLYEYSRGLLADPNCPAALRDNQMLMMDFPPKVLPGLVGILWRPPEPLSKGRVGNKPRSCKEILTTS